LQVFNGGDAAATLDAARCVLHAGGLAIGLDTASPTTLARGATTTLVFTPTAWPAMGATGAIPVQVDLHGTQPGGAFDARLDPPPVNVQASATAAVTIVNAIASHPNRAAGQA